MPEKSMVPNIFNGEVDGWRIWRDDVSDFLDTRNSGMQRLLEEISQHKGLPVQEVLRKMASLGVKVLSDSVQVWRALKGLTSGVARVVVQSVEGENGFEALEATAPPIRTEARHQARPSTLSPLQRFSRIKTLVPTASRVSGIWHASST